MAGSSAGRDGMYQPTALEDVWAGAGAEFSNGSARGGADRAEFAIVKK